MMTDQEFVIAASLLSTARIKDMRHRPGWEGTEMSALEG